MVVIPNSHAHHDLHTIRASLVFAFSSVFRATGRITQADAKPLGVGGQRLPLHRPTGGFFRLTCFLNSLTFSFMTIHSFAQPLPCRMLLRGAGGEPEGGQAGETMTDDRNSAG